MPDIGHDTVVGKMLRLPFRLVPQNVMLPILQGPLRGKRWVLGASRYSCLLGTYEIDKQRAFIDEVKPGSVVYDLGANVGYYSLLSSVLVGAAGRVHSFEPLNDNLQTIRRHLSANSVTNCTLHSYAISNFNGTATFEANAESNTMGHLSESRGQSVEVTTLDDLVYQRSMEPPDLIKCDIEGAEFDMLNGARRVFQQYRPILFLATHTPHVRQQCNDWLRSLSYQLKSLDKSLAVGESDEIIAFPASK